MELVKIAFKVFNTLEEAAKSSSQEQLPQNAMLQVHTLAAALRPSAPKREAYKAPSPLYPAIVNFASDVLQMKLERPLIPMLPQPLSAKKDMSCLPTAWPWEVGMTPHRLMPHH